MDKRVMDFLARKMSGRQDYRDYNNGGRGGDYGDYEHDRRGEYPMDGRRGVKGTGRYGIGGSEYRGDRRDYADYDDRRGYDERDYAQEPLQLSKTDMQLWKKRMRNVDGTSGEHYDMQQIMQVAEKMGIKFNHFDEREFCLAVNMLYSDYCGVTKKHFPPDKELIFYVEMAKAFLEDPDGPEPATKLALYYHCIVDSADI